MTGETGSGQRRQRCGPQRLVNPAANSGRRVAGGSRALLQILLPNKGFPASRRHPEVHQVARKSQPGLARIVDRIRASPVVHADETGWRQDGANGYVWTFSTPTDRYFLRRGRNKEVVDEVLDESFSGVLVSDFYAAYNHYPGLKQRWWAHLLREVHDLKALYPKDQKLARWAADVHRLWELAKDFSHPKAQQRRLAQGKFERALLARCQAFLEDPAAVQNKLCRRIKGFIKELFVFVTELAAPSDNNPAERSLRPLL